MLEMDDKSKIIKRLGLLVIKICTWPPRGLDGRKVCSQSLFSLLIIILKTGFNFYLL